MEKRGENVTVNEKDENLVIVTINKKDENLVIVYAILLSEQMRSIASPDVQPGWW